MTVLSTIREDPPPSRWFTALFQGQTHDWQRVKTPRQDALCCATPSFHLTGTGDRQEIMLSLHPFFFFSICSTYNGKHSGCVSTLHAKRRQWSSILQAERRETAAALQKHVCRWRLCVQIGCPVISTSEKTWARTHNRRGKEEIPPRMSQLCLYRHVLWKWRMLWSYSRRKYTVYTTTAITSIQMLISVHQFVFYFGWDEKILTTIWSTAVKFSPNIRQGTTRSGSGDPSTFLHAPPWDRLHNYLAACYEMYCNALTHDQIPTETQSNHHEWINAGTCLFLHVEISILRCLAALMVRLCSGNKIHFIALREVSVCLDLSPPTKLKLKIKKNMFVTKKTAVKMSKWSSGVTHSGRRVSTCNLISVIFFVEILATKLI